MGAQEMGESDAMICQKASPEGYGWQPTVHALRSSRKVYFSLPRQLQRLPFADKEKIVLRRKQLKISGVSQAYNPSIARCQEGFVIFFRNDRVKKTPLLQRQCTLAKAVVRRSFRQVGKTVFFHTSHAICEDPRCFQFQDQLFLAYSHVIQWSPYTTYEAMARVSGDHLVDVMHLQYHPSRIEKNWVPFTYNDPIYGPDLYFIYSANPFKILRLARSMDGTIEQPGNESFSQEPLVWETKWGKISGGTPGRLISQDEYLSFFHSSFKADGIKWYVIGAYTFENKPPFRIKRISKYPLVWRHMYTTPMSSTVWFRPRQEFRVAFPGGFEEGTKKGRKVLYLAYGENDSGLCVLTLDKNRLLRSLQDIELAITLHG